LTVLTLDFPKAGRLGWGLRAWKTEAGGKRQGVDDDSVSSGPKGCLEQTPLLLFWVPPLGMSDYITVIGGSPLAG
jgi:hypothetical protein